MNLHPMLKQVWMGLASPLARFDDRLGRPPVREDCVPHLGLRAQHARLKIGEHVSNDTADGAHGVLPVRNL